MKKRLLTILMAMVLLLCMTSGALASGVADGADASTSSATEPIVITIERTFSVSGILPSEAVNPVDHLSVGLTRIGFTDKDGASIDGAMPPNISINPDKMSIAMSSVKDGETGTATLDITLPTGTELEAAAKTSSNYTTPHIAHYQFNINTDKYPSAGITYQGGDLQSGQGGNLTLVNYPLDLYITTYYIDGVLTTSAIIKDEAEAKQDPVNIDATYEAGGLKITKEIVGSGDPKDDFTVQLTFTSPANRTLRNWTIQSDDVGNALNDAYKAAANAETVWENGGSLVIEFPIKHGETKLFTNIPKGVSYKIEEINVPDEYESSFKVSGSNQGTITEVVNPYTATIVNTGDLFDPDTGISLDNLPYILLLGVVLAGVLVLIFKRRTAEDNE